MPGWHLISRALARAKSQVVVEKNKPKFSKASLFAFVICALLISGRAMAIDVNSTVIALRMANSITGGLMPTSDPLFQQMVTKIAAGDKTGAANLATSSPYFAKYLARRLALQMMAPALDASVAVDNDASAFIVAHFVGSSGATVGTIVKPSISSIWSDNSTYLVNVTANGVTTPTHVASLTSAQFSAVNWLTDITQTAGQKAQALTTANGKTTATAVTIPQQHVGGYITLSDRAGDTSFAQFAATAGTNLRMIEGLWEISTGLQLLDVASADASPADVPRFIPEYNPNFFQGQGQTACIACHGGGFSSINHGYAAVADIFDYTAANGFAYIATPATATMKSLGSDPKARTNNSACNLIKTPTAVCNPDSVGVGNNNSWNLAATWSATGVLSKMGWSGPTTGNGLNALGAALGQAKIVYEFLTKRVVGEICPMGAFTASDVATIAAAANPFSQTAGTDDVRTIVALVASNPTCQ